MYTYVYISIHSYSPLLVRGRLIIRYLVSISEFLFFGMGQFPNLQGEGTKNFRALVNLLGYLVRVGLVEVRARFWGCIIKISCVLQSFCFVGVWKTKTNSHFEGRGDGFCSPKRHQHPGGVTIALATAAHVLESNVLGANHFMLELHLEDFEDPL